MCQGYNPSTYETDLPLDAQIVVHDAKQAELDEILAATPDLERLYKAQYGTSQYDVSILSWEYYSNWGRADEIVEALQMKNWSEVTAYVIAR